MLPDAYILKDNLIIVDGENQFRYQVTYTIFGEVLAIDIPILKLPEQAQRMTLGENTETYLEQLTTHSGMIKYMLPLIVLGFWKTEEYNHIVKNVEEREADLVGEIPEDFLPLITDDWVRRVYLKLKSDVENKHTVDFWNNLVCLVVADKKYPYDLFQKLGKDHYDLPHEILVVKIKLEKRRRELHFLFEGLAYFPHPEIESFLIETLKETKVEGNKVLLSSIYKGLSVYQSEENYKLFLSEYERHKEDGQLFLIGPLLQHLYHYRTSAVLKIAMSLITARNYYLAVDAFFYLKKQGISEIRVAEILRIALQKDDTLDRAEILMAVSSLLSDKEMLLKGEEYLEIACKAFGGMGGENLKTLRPDTFINFQGDEYLNRVLRRVWSSSISGMIIQLLHHQKPSMKRLGLAQIRATYLADSAAKTYFSLSKDTILKIFELSNSGAFDVWTEAWRVIHALAKFYATDAWIGVILKSTHRDTTFANEAIDELHQNGFRNVAIPAYATKYLISRSSPDQRIRAVELLLYYKNDTVEKILKDWEKLETSNDVLDVINMGWHQDRAHYRIRKK